MYRAQTAHIRKGMEFLGEPTLDELPEKEVYTRLIDAYRLYENDDNEEEGGDPCIELFKYFLDKAEKPRGAALRVLPPWWSGAKRKECEKIAQDAKGRSCAGEPVSAIYLEGRYGKDGVMQLRTLGEQVHGMSPGYPMSYQDFMNSDCSDDYGLSDGDYDY